jgi:hypothetical protein
MVRLGDERGPIGRPKRRPRDKSRRWPIVPQQDADAAETTPWQIELKNGLYRLVNTTNTPKYFVPVTGAVRPMSATVEHSVIAGRGSVANDALAGASRTVMVHWQLSPTTGATLNASGTTNCRNHPAQRRRRRSRAGQVRSTTAPPQEVDRLGIAACRTTLSDECWAPPFMGDSRLQAAGQRC